MSIYDFFLHRRSWRQFYSLISQLPYWGRYMAAIAADEGWASYVLDKEEAGEEVPGQAAEGPSVAHYSPVVARLDLLADRVLSVRTAVQAGYSKDHQEPHFEPVPRPTTALERERERRGRNLLLELEAQILGEGLALSAAE